MHEFTKRKPEDFQPTTVDLSSTKFICPLYGPAFFKTGFIFRFDLSQLGTGKTLLRSPTRLSNGRTVC